ncbi:MAG: phenylalanine--tRNA ligase subunit alpha, partial [Gemmatimonadales bacterium]
MIQTTGYPELDEIAQRLDRVHALDARELEAEEIALLGRKAGALTALLKRVAGLPIEERKRYGALVNQLKGQLEAAFAERREAVGAEQRRQQDAGRDLTMPARRRWVGAEHPVTRVVDEIVEIFRGIGFTVAVGPEVETDWYNFLALNFPADHPAMDMHDTLYLDAPPVEGEPSGRLLLRTHTSPVQIRTLLASPPPVRVVIPGMVYRNDAFDASHSPAFSQIEGLAMDEGISFVDLKATLVHFAHRFFTPTTKVRFRPSFFPFTEPSAEMDVECQLCHGSGCPACKSTGWM